MPNADGIAMILSEHALIEDGRLANGGYLAVKIAEAIESGDYDGIQMHGPMTEHDILEGAVDRMGWPEIHAFQDELRKGQDYREDAGGFMMRAIRRLFGLPSPGSEVETYQDAARAMVAKAMAEQAMPKSHS